MEKLTVDLLGVVSLNFLDDSLLGQLDESSSGERSVDLESVDEDGYGDETVRSYLLEELVILVLVEHDGVVSDVSSAARRQKAYTICACISSQRIHTDLLHLTRGGWRVDLACRKCRRTLRVWIVTYALSLTFPFDHFFLTAMMSTNTSTPFRTENAPLSSHGQVAAACNASRDRSSLCPECRCFLQRNEGGRCRMPSRTQQQSHGLTRERTGRITLFA